MDYLGHRTNVLQTIFWQVIGAKRAEIAADVRAYTNGVVKFGAFEGLKIPDEVSWGDGDFIPKALGVYEAELLAVLERWRHRTYNCVVNVGAADGYYSSGLGLVFKDCPIYAFDTNEASHKVIAAAAGINNLTGRTRIGGMCTPQVMSCLLREYDRCLVVSDCEGYERDLFTDPELTPLLARSDLMIELHDIFVPGVTPAITAALETSHTIEIDREGPRDPSAFEVLRHRDTMERYIALSEHRAQTMSWMFCSAKQQI